MPRGLDGPGAYLPPSPAAVKNQLYAPRAAACNCELPPPKLAYLQAMDAVTAARAGTLPVSALFLYSPGGCGKTFVENLILASVRAEGEIALAVASAGVAALLLDGGCLLAICPKAQN